MTWEIFIGFAALTAFLIPIMTIVVKVTRILTSVQGNLEGLAARLSEKEKTNSKSHERIYNRLDVLEKNAARQDVKINNLERM